MIVAVVLPLLYGFAWTGYQLLRPLENFAPIPATTELIDAKSAIVLAEFTDLSKGEQRSK